MTQKLRYFCTLLLVAVVSVAWADTGTITFSTNGVKINGANVTGDDNLGNTWTITTVGTTSFTTNAAYYQVGSSSKPASSITFTTTLSEDVNIESMSAKFGGFNGTAGTITLKVGETEIGTGSLNAANDVTVNSNSTAVGKVLTITVTGISKGVKVYNISYTYSAASGDTPSISASNVNIDYDVTGGEISYTINNGVDGGVLNASVTDGDWLTLSGTNFESPIAFTCDANTVNAARTATVTLTYTYDNETITKDVTVTQAAAPVIYTTIPDLFAAATSTATDVNVQFNNWVVTGVSTNGKNVFVTDGTNGFAIYDSSGSLASTYAVGNTLAGLASCKLKLQNGYAQLQDVNAADLTIGTGGSVDFATITMADLAGVNTGALVQYENLTCSVDNNKYYLSDGTTTIQVYTTLYSDLANSLEDGKIYNITGVYQQYNTTKEILPRSADDIEEVVPTEPTVTVNPTAVEVDAAEHDGTITVTCENMGENLDISVFFCEETDVTAPAYYNWIDAEIDNQNNVYYVIEANTATEARKAYMVVKVADADAKEVYTSKLITFTQAGKELPSVTWDLSTNSYDEITDENIVTWSSNFATMTNSSKSGGTKATNYLGGDANNRTSSRFYSNNTLTIAPKAGYKITKVEFTATSSNYASALNNSTWTNATAEVDGTNVTVTPTNGNLAMVATIGGTCGFTGVKVYYEESDVMVIEIKNGFTATTFSCNKALDFTNADVTAQIITDEVGTTQTVRVVPAETGLYITGEPGIHEIPVADASAETDNVDSNKLKAVMEASQFATQNSVTFYAFGKQKGKEAFYKIPTSGYNVPAGKAVLRITKANAPEMIVVNGGTTGVESIENSQLTTDNYYTVDGRLVNGKPTQKGIYIVGGRKVVVK